MPSADLPLASELDFRRVVVQGATAPNGGAVSLQSSVWSDHDGLYVGNTGFMASVFALDASTITAHGTGFFGNLAPSSGQPWMALKQSTAALDRVEIVRSTGTLRVEDGGLTLSRSRVLDSLALASVECAGAAPCTLTNTVFAGRPSRTTTGVTSSSIGALTLQHDDWIGHSGSAIVMTAGSGREENCLFHDNGGLSTTGAVAYTITDRVVIDPQYAAFDEDYLSYANATFLPLAPGALSTGAMAGFDGDRNAWTFDVDGDGLPDAFELPYCGGIVACDPNDDLDGDGLSNFLEAAAFTSPVSDDTDGDGTPDNADTAPLDPNVP